jgi:hypothetical protein
MMVQHNFTTDLPPDELANIRVEAEGLRDQAIVYDPSDPKNVVLITIWDDLEAAKRAAGGADLLQRATGERAAASGQAKLYVSPRSGEAGASGAEAGTTGPDSY